MLRPLSDNVVIEPVIKEKKTTSGIILTGDAVNPAYGEGVVVAIGPGYLVNNVRNIMSVSVGDYVFYHNYDDSHLINIDGKNILVLPESAIFAVKENN